MNYPFLRKKYGKDDGFTLLEVIIATFILSIGVVGAFALLQSAQRSAALGSSQLRASYLAQEGIEIARNIRDTNLLSIHKGLGGTWGDGLNTCVTGCEADYNDTQLFDDDRFLLLDTDGWYTYDSGTPTSFKRKIVITPVGTPVMKLIVTVNVSFSRAGKIHVVTAETELYNWITP